MQVREPEREHRQEREQPQLGQVRRKQGPCRGQPRESKYIIWLTKNIRSVPKRI